MLFIRSDIPHKSWIYSLLFRGQGMLTSSTVNWMMKRGNNSPLFSNKSKRSRTNMDQSTDNTFQAAYESNHASHGNITEVTGDLFSCPNTHSLAHCISADVKMGKGIAVTFKNRFQGISELLSQRQGPGGLAILNREQRFVYYLVTKGKYWEKPTYDTLRSSLERMRDHNVKNGVENVCMPKIGCGLDKLQWHKVLAMIREIYKGSDIQITIYHFDDGKKDTAKGRGKQKSLDGNVEDGRRGQHGRAVSRMRDDGEEKAYNEVGTQRRYDHRKEDQYQRSNYQYKSEHRHPGSGRGYPPREPGPTNRRQRYQNSGERYPRGSAEHGSWPGKSQEYGPKLPPNAKKKSKEQSNIQGYFTKSQKEKDTFEEDFPTLKKPDRNEKVDEQRDQQHKTSADKNSTSPIKIKRPNRSGGYGKDETRDGLDNGGTSTDVKKVDDTERKADENKGQKDKKNDGKPPKCEGSSQEANDSEQSNVCENERQDEKGNQTTTNNGKEQRKGSHDEDRDEHNKDQTCPEEDKVAQDDDKRTEESETLKVKREDSNTIPQNESHSETKNSDVVSQASASEGTVVNTPQRQEEDASVTSNDGTTGKSTQEQGKDREKDEKKSSGSTDETPNSKKKKRKRKKKNKK